MKEMIRKARRMLGCLNREESGFGTLMVVLAMVILGALILTPLLAFTISGMDQGQTHQERTDEYYAADTGVEDALWKVRNDALPEWMKETWGEYAFSHDFTYNLGSAINEKDVSVTLQPIWVLEGLETPNATQQREPNQNLITVGNVIGTGQFQVAIIRSDTFSGELKIERIGCWLPAGFSYVAGSSNMEQDVSAPYYCKPTISSYNNGTLVTWEYTGSINFDTLPGDPKFPLNRKIVTFNFTPQQNMKDSFCWVKTTDPNVWLSWDTSLKLYQIKSTSIDPVTNKNTTVTTSTSRSEFSKTGAVAGDYQATGNALLRDPNIADGRFKGTRYQETPAQITDIPASASVEKVMIYWSGWINDPWNVWYENKPVDQWTSADQQALLNLVSTKKVNQVQLKVEVAGEPTAIFNQTVTASLSQVLPNGHYGSPHGWSYSCYADVTDIVAAYFNDQGISFMGNAKYTVGHASSVLKDSSQTGCALYGWKDNHAGETVVYRTDYPLANTTRSIGDPSSAAIDEWANGGWSVVVIYSSPETKGHQLYLYDTFRYCDSNQTLVFDIENFLAPQDVLNDSQAARLTCFVGEGDIAYTGDSLSVNGYNLSDAINPWNNVWNSRSNVLPPAANDGVDIDTFSAGNGIIQPGDTQAQIRLPTGTDVWNLVYIILSFRSEVTSGGLNLYRIQVGG